MEAELPLSTTVSFDWLWDYTEGLGVLKEGQWIALIKKKNLIVPKNLKKESHYVMKIDIAHSVNCDLNREEKMFLLLWLGKHSQATIFISCKIKVTSTVFHLLVTDIMGSHRYSSCPIFFHTTSETSSEILNKQKLNAAQKLLIFLNSSSIFSSAYRYIKERTIQTRERKC